MSMFPSLKDFSEIFQNPRLRRFPSLSVEDVFSHNTGITISEGPKDIQVEVDMPGLSAKEIKVKLENGLLQIEGEKREEVEENERRFYKRSSRVYRSTIELPVTIDENQKVDAFYDKGVMHIVIPKAQQSQGKEITVREKDGNIK